MFDAFGSNVSTDGATDPYSGYGGQAGYYSDSETGLELCTFRFYDPANGRFVNRDPLRYGGGVNLYNYTGNAGINQCDPLGLSSLPGEAASISLGIVGGGIGLIVGGGGGAIGGTCIEPGGGSLFGLVAGGAAGAVTGYEMGSHAGQAIGNWASQMNDNAGSGSGNSSTPDNGGGGQGGGGHDSGPGGYSREGGGGGNSGGGGENGGGGGGNSGGGGGNNGGGPPISMDDAIDQAVNHVGPDGILEQTPKGNFQFRSNSFNLERK